MFKKRIIIFISDIIAVAYFVLRKTAAYFGYKRDGGAAVRILVYHSVSSESFYKDAAENNVSLDMFREQLKMLKTMRRKIVGIDNAICDMENGDLKDNIVVITFDDGLSDTYRNAASVLEAQRIPAVFFVVYKYADRDGKDFIGWDEVYSLKKKGFDIGAHSYSHKRLALISAGELEEETVYAKRCFEKKGINVVYFAYPYGFYGDFSKETEEAVKKAGFRACFTSIAGENLRGANLFELKRTRVSWRDNRWRFRLRMEGAYDWVDFLKSLLSRKKKLFHKMASPS